MRRKKEETADEIKAKMRPVRCPQCGCRIMDAVEGTKAQFITSSMDRYPDFMIKCRHCGAEIGVIKTE
nr:MAG TPA: Transcription initiation factor IIE, alpha FINGER, Transcription [Caudoviricetes sp.]